MEESNKAARPVFEPNDRVVKAVSHDGTSSTGFDGQWCGVVRNFKPKCREWLKLTDHCPREIQHLLRVPDGDYLSSICVFEKLLHVPTLDDFTILDSSDIPSGVDMTCLKLEVLGLASDFPVSIHFDGRLVAQRARSNFSADAGQHDWSASPIVLTDRIDDVSSACSRYLVDSLKLLPYQGAVEHEGLVYMSTSHALILSLERRYREFTFRHASFVVMSPEMFRRVRDDFDPACLPKFQTFQNFQTNIRAISRTGARGMVAVRLRLTAVVHRFDISYPCTFSRRQEMPFRARE